MSEFMKFWSLGAEATLNLTTSGGNVKVEFNCTLGQPNAPHSLPPFPPPPHRPRHRGPAKRERNRLRAARHQATRAEEITPVSSAPTLTVSDSATDVSSTESVAPAVVKTTHVP